MKRKRITPLVLVLAILSLLGCGAGQQPVPEPASPPPSLAEPNGKVLMVLPSRLNLRTCPSMTCQIIAVLPRGQEVVKLGAEAGWLRVHVPAIQKEGWVGARHVGIGGHRPPMLPPPGATDGSAVPESPIMPGMGVIGVTPEIQTAPEVNEEWATPEKPEAPEMREEGTAPADRTAPEVKEEFAK